MRNVRSNAIEERQLAVAVASALHLGVHVQRQRVAAAAAVETLRSKRREIASG